MDRDGVISKLPPMVPGDSETWYIMEFEDFEFLPGAMDAIHLLLRQTNYEIFVVSNQSCVGKGLATYRNIEGIFVQMQHALKLGAESVSRFHWAFCRHDTGVGCACRKPKPGLIYFLAVGYEIALGQSWMIGDMNTDMRAGWNAGIRRLIRITDECDPPRQMKFNSTRGHPRRSLMDAAKFIIALDGLHSAKTS